jgi:YidC/Oxa1 family membrane protein insertase
MQNDKTSYIGLFIIGAILFGWMYFNSPSKEQQAREKAKQDSIARVEEAKTKQKESITPKQAEATPTKASVPLTDSARKADSAKKMTDYGILYPAMKGTMANTLLENDMMKLVISNKGGKISSVELKNFKTSAGTPLILFYPDSIQFGLILNAYSRFLSTDSLYFTARDKASAGDSSSVTMRLNTSEPDKYIDFTYSVKKGSYLVGCTLKTVGMQNILPANSSEIVLNWAMHTPSQEANLQNQQRTSTVYYKNYGDEVDYISPMKDEKKPLPASISWVSFKQQYFSSILIAGTKFQSPEVSSFKAAKPDKVKSFAATLSIPYEHKPNESFGMQFYFGPNNYKLLKSYSENNDLQLDRQINLGWGIFGWVNRFIVIQIFDFLGQFNMNYGLVILILTIVIKACLFPIAFRTYVSTAKMRLLKPEMDELAKKFPKSEDAMKKQQAVMALQKKAGVNPLAGCIPLLLQLPILYALFSFFPASIELRQQGFLWAHDLSTYDAPIVFHGFTLPFLGDHISIFAVFFTLSQYLYLTVNQQTMGGPANDQMGKTMKWMMYIMPVIFFGVLNNYSAGLSYYYILANLITFGQVYFARLFIDEAALHRKMQENKTKVAKPSKFQARLEQMVKDQQARQKGK